MPPQSHWGGLGLPAYQVTPVNLYLQFTATQLLDGDFQRTQSIFRQVFSPYRPMAENVHAISQRIGLPIRMIRILPDKTYHIEEFGQSMSVRHKPSEDRIRDVMKKPATGLCQYFRDTKEINFYTIQRSPQTTQAAMTPVLGHELFHALQEKDGIGTFDMAEESSENKGHGWMMQLQRQLNDSVNALVKKQESGFRFNQVNPANPVSDLTGQSKQYPFPVYSMLESFHQVARQVLAPEISRCFDLALLSAAYRAAKAEFQAHEISRELSAAIGDREHMMMDMGSKVTYGMVAECLYYRIQSLMPMGDNRSI